MSAAASIGGLLREAIGQLSAVSDSARLDAEMLLAHVSGLSRASVLAFPERVLDGTAAARLARLVARRRAGEPLAYLVGRKDFFTLTLEVGPGVLVPRPETEHLLEALLERLPQDSPARRPAVLDLGTGSGALALAVKEQRPDADVTGTDSSRAALAIARVNAERLRLAVRWIESDWFDALGGRRYTAIVCNPPYVASDDPHLAALHCEPRAALDGGVDGLDAIRSVLRAAPQHLMPDGILVLEHGHEQQRAVARLAADNGLAVELAGRDLAGHERFVVLRSART